MQINDVPDLVKVDASAKISGKRGSDADGDCWRFGIKKSDDKKMRRSGEKLLEITQANESMLQGLLTPESIPTQSPPEFQEEVLVSNGGSEGQGEVTQVVETVVETNSARNGSLL